MEVTYTKTLDDFVAFGHHFRKSKKVWASSLLSRLIIPVTVLAAAVVLVVSLDLWLWAAWLLLTGLLFAVRWPAISRNQFDSKLREHGRQNGVFGKNTLILSEKSFVEITGTTRTEVHWKDIYGIDEIGDYTFIFVAALEAFILPRHGFESENEYESVRDYALTHCGLGQSLIFLTETAKALIRPL